MDAQESGWKHWVGISNNLWGVVGGVVLVLTWLLHIPWPFALFAYGFGFACFIFWVAGFVFVSGNQPMTSLGSLSSIVPPKQDLALLGLPSEPRPRPLDTRITNPPVSTGGVATAATFEPLAAAQSEGNIQLQWDDDDNYFRIARSREEPRVFRENANVRPPYNSVLVQFCNESKPPLGIRGIQNVTATVRYYDPDNSDIVDLRTNGCWLNDSSASVSFEPDIPRYLILGTFIPADKAFNFQVFDAGDKEFWVMGVAASNINYKILVQLRWGEARQYGIDRTFELVANMVPDPDPKVHGSSFFELSRISEGSGGRPVKVPRGRVPLR